MDVHLHIVLCSIHTTQILDESPHNTVYNIFIQSYYKNIYFVYPNTKTCAAYILYVGHLSLSKSRNSLILAKSLPVHDCCVTRIQECFACTGKCLRPYLERHLRAQIYAVSRYLKHKIHIVSSHGNSETTLVHTLQSYTLKLHQV